MFQTFAAIGDFGSVVEQLLMTHGKKITSKIIILKITSKIVM